MSVTTLNRLVLHTMDSQIFRSSIKKIKEQNDEMID